MKILRTVTTLAVPLLFGSLSLAQADADSFAASTSAVAKARCQYSQADDVCSRPENSAPVASSAKTDSTLTQLPQRFPGPSRPPRRRPVGHPGVAYAPMPMPTASGRNVAIGALVGFTVGAIAPQNASGRARIGVGLIGAAFGALIGAAIPSVPSYHLHRHRWPDYDDDELASRPPTAKSPSQRPEPPTVLAAQPKVLKVCLHESPMNLPISTANPFENKLSGEPQVPVAASDK